MLKNGFLIWKANDGLIYVSDVVVNNNLKSLTKGKNKIININTSKTVSVTELIKVISKKVFGL
jgi:hypothetical protein